MSQEMSPRARRQKMEWPARIRTKGQTTWCQGRVVNLSVTGALLRVERQYAVGESVEVEIDFLSRPDCQTIVAGTGCVVRKHTAIPDSAAVQFDSECSIARRQGPEKTLSDPVLGDWRGPGQSALSRTNRPSPF